MEEMSTDVTAPLALLALCSPTAHFADGAAVADPRLLLEVRIWQILLFQAEGVMGLTARYAVEHFATSRCAADETEVFFRPLLTADNPNPIHRYIFFVEWLKEIYSNIAFAW